VQSSKPFSATLAVGLRPSRLQSGLLAVLGAGAVLPGLLLPLAPLLRAGWIALSVLLCAVEHRRTDAGRRVTALGRTGDRWWVTVGEGARLTGRLGAYWCSRHCAYLEITTGRFRCLHLLVWRDAVTSPAAYRDLCRHLRLSR